MLKEREVYVVKRNIEWYGRPIDFWRKVKNKYGEEKVKNKYGEEKVKNKYGEETESKEIVTTLRCVYHASKTKSSRSGTDAARTNMGRGEYLLTLYNSDIKPDDICLFNRTEYRVTDVYSLDKADSIMEISIEEVR